MLATSAVSLVLNVIKMCLLQSKVWEPPRVLINTTVGSLLMQQLVDIVKRMQVHDCICHSTPPDHTYRHTYITYYQGVIVESVEEASHVIYPPPPPSPNDEEYVRPLLVRGKNVLVHWWYYPDRWACSVHASFCILSLMTGCVM